MALTAAEKNKVAARFVLREFNQLGKTANLDADAIRAAAEAMIEQVIRSTTPATATSFKTWVNSVLPQPFKGTATLEQKTLLFAYAALFDAGLL